MKSIKLNIKTSEEGRAYILQKQGLYSHAKRCIYKQTTSKSTSAELKQVAKAFGLNNTEAVSLASEAKTLFSQTQTNKESLEQRIIDLQEKIQKLKQKQEKDRSKEQCRKRNLYKFKNKLAQLDRSLSKDITFGGKELLRELSYLSNAIHKLSGEQSDKEKVKKHMELEKRRKEAKTLYQSKRIHSIYIMGEANQKGNRFFNFDLKNGKIVYKPNAGTKIELKFSDKRKDLLEQLQLLIDNNAISITVNLSADSISLSYDDAALSGFAVNESERYIECQEVKRQRFTKEQESKLIKDIYRKYYQERDARMMKGKKEKRFMAFDSNPNFIGVAVIDRNDDLSFNVVETWFYDLTEMNAKLPKEASATDRAKQTFQRRHGIIHIWKDVFEQAAYLRVGTFVSEKLSFDKKDERMGKEANRQTKNVWHRELSKQTIAGQCTKLGIKLMEVHPAYSSTVGNINYSLVDCINAALELGRRGAFRKLEGAFYPLIAETGLHAMRRMNKRSSGDVEALEGCNGWKELHGVIKEAGLRYRRSLRDLTLSGREDTTHLRSAKLRYGKIDKHILSLRDKRICFQLSSIVGDV